MADHHDEAHGSGSGLPVWVRATAIVGIPGVIAFFYVWTSSMNLAQRADVEHLRERVDHYLMQAERNQRLLTQICANTAKDNVERAQCFN